MKGVEQFETGLCPCSQVGKDRLWASVSCLVHLLPSFPLIGNNNSHLFVSNSDNSCTIGVSSPDSVFIATLIYQHVDTKWFKYFYLFIHSLCICVVRSAPLWRWAAAQQEAVSPPRPSHWLQQDAPRLQLISWTANAAAGADAGSQRIRGEAEEIFTCRYLIHWLRVCCKPHQRCSSLGSAPRNKAQFLSRWN